jgi:hypothetical protein
MTTGLSTNGIVTESAARFRVFGSFWMTEDELVVYLEAADRKRAALKVEFANGGVMTDTIANRIAGYMSNWRARYLKPYAGVLCREHGVMDFCNSLSLGGER